MRKLLSIMALFVISLLTVSMVSAASSTLGGLNTSYGSVTIEVNDEEDDSTLLSVEEGEELNVEVELAIEDNGDLVDDSAKNVEIEARLTGYEDEDVVENVLVNKVTEGTEQTKKLKMLVPNDFPNGKATLRVLVFGGNEVIADKTYELFVESPSHSVKIADVSFSPSLTVKAGRSLLATVLVENVGEENEDDVKVTVEVPELNLKASEYVDELDADESEDVDEMFLQVPPYTKAGEYTLKVTVQYDDLDKSVTETYVLKLA